MRMIACERTISASTYLPYSQDRRTHRLDETTVQNYRPDDLVALVNLINEADVFDKLERATTLQELGHEMSSPTAHPETDFFVAWSGDRLVGYVDLFVRRGDAFANTESIVYCWGVVHPQWRRRGLGRRLLEIAFRRAKEYLPELGAGEVHFQGTARDVEGSRQALFTSFGMRQVRYFVNLARPLNGNLGPVQLPTGIRLRTIDLERDIETVWQVANTAFRDHWGHTEGKLEEFEHWVKMPHFRPELWYLAEQEASGKVVGLGLSLIDPDWIAQTGRQEGYVDTLAVLREHRKQGLGTALLMQSLHALRRAGMESAHLHADADNLTGAMRLYHQSGFSVRKTSMAFRRSLREPL
jgi:mycothiol synthase